MDKEKLRIRKEEKAKWTQDILKGLEKHIKTLNNSRDAEQELIWNEYRSELVALHNSIDNYAEKYGLNKLELIKEAQSYFLELHNLEFINN